VVDGVTRIDLPGRKWPSRKWAPSGVSKLGTSSVQNCIPCFVAGPENRVSAVALDLLLHGHALNDDIRDSSSPPFQSTPFQSTQCHPSPSKPILFNPLVLLGATGCGKTHLARGIANYWQDKLLSQGQSPDKIVYLSAVEFDRLYNQAREQDKLNQLQSSLRNLQLLVLEDLHAIRSRSIVQLELRHTVDALLDNDRMILITSQKPLATIPSLEPGLRDRLASGLTIRISPPGVEARFDILQLTARARGTDLDKKQARSMSGQLEGPAPRLFQAIAQLEQDHLREESNSPVFAEAPLSMRQILAVVARYFSISQAMLRGPSRRRCVVHARNVAVYLARVLTNMSYAQIGRELGKRDHTTTMHANRRVGQLLSTDPATQETVDDLKRILTAA